ncbi:MAG: VUT family protein [Gammaproteobacteria bacterium]|nr:VUT family protein [Gammaproteobacteria bacterium]
MKWFSLIGFLLCIPAANWLIGNVGTTCIPNGPCLIPVAPGLSAPSGVLMIGLALVLRDVVQQTLGRTWAMWAIVIGAALSWLLASPYLALASGVAFLLAEGADMAVYTPLRNQGRIIAAVLLSGVVGSIIDSAVFLWLAFGSLEYITGQVVGKMWMTGIAAIALSTWIFRNANKH